jgi:hypothetical protein
MLAMPIATGFCPIDEAAVATHSAIADETDASISLGRWKAPPPRTA